MSRESIEIDIDRGGDKYIQDIAARAGVGGFAVSNLNHFLTYLEQAFCDQESASQLRIVTWSAHGYGDALAANSNLQRFLPGEPIGCLCG